jgi:CTP synthase
MGGTMRLGLRPTIFDSDSEKWSKVRKLYGGVDKIWERHRHRYEVNPQLVDRLQQSGCSFIGRDEKGERMQVLELKGRFLVYHLNLISHSINPDHPYFVGLQAHPEFCTRPLNPSPPFLGFIAASAGQTIFEEQLEYQMANFRPPHPDNAMVSEAVLRNETEKTRMVNGVSGDVYAEERVIQVVNND